MASSGLIVVDKPSGMTSHDVVACVRRIAGTRKVGHAGTLDPMATGVLILGVERATKLLGYVMGQDKVYEATVRLGQRTTTDDREGEILASADASRLDLSAVRAAFNAQVGLIAQVPSSVSAIKVGGKRAYALVREGHQPDLPSREVRVEEIDLHRIATSGEALDVDVTVRCSSGTYIRAIARDVGQALGVGGHLTALRRTAIGQLGTDVAFTLDDLARLDDPVGMPLSQAVQRILGIRRISAEQARELSFGRAIGAAPEAEIPKDGARDVVGALAPDGSVVALVDARGKPVTVFAPATS